LDETKMSVLYPLTNPPYQWKSKYLDPRSLEEFIALEEREQIRLLSSTFSNYLKFAVNTGPRDEQLAEFIYEIDEALETNEKPYISVRSGHGTGKTYILANLSNYIGLTEDDAKIVLTAPVAAQLENQLMPELKKWSENLFPLIAPLVDVKTKHATYGAGKGLNRAVARTARKNNSEALAGVHGSFVLYILDEASGIDQKIFEVIEGALTGERFLFVMCSNPTRTVGNFYDSHTKNKKFYRTIHLNSENSANVKKAWLDTMAKKFGADSDIYNVRVKGNFPKTMTDALFTIEMLEQFFDTKRVVDDSGVEVWGNDIARYGDDKTRIFKRKGYRGYGFAGWEKQDLMKTAARVVAEYNQSYTKPDYIVIDTNGLGVGVYDRVNELGLDGVAQDGNSNYKATNDMYLNKRAEMYHNLADAMKKGASCPYDEELEEELLATTYSVTQNGLIKIIPKDEIKEIISRSPDKGDAVALSYFENFITKEYKPEQYANTHKARTVPGGAW
jgi:hypothetical protein